MILVSLYFGFGNSHHHLNAGKKMSNKQKELKIITACFYIILRQRGSTQNLYSRTSQPDKIYNPAMCPETCVRQRDQ